MSHPVAFAQHTTSVCTLECVRLEYDAKATEICTLLDSYLFRYVEGSRGALSIKSQRAERLSRWQCTQCAVAAPGAVPVAQPQIEESLFG